MHLDNMDSLSVIENRIEQLEYKLGYNGEDHLDKAIVEQISSIESLLNTISAGRDDISEMNKRIDELNLYLDPLYINTIDDVKTKCNYILTNEPSIRHHCKNMQMCQEKLPVLDSDALAEIPKYNKTLQSMNQNIHEEREECDQMEKCIQQMMEKFQEMSLSIMEQLVSMNKRIDSLEKKLPK